MGCLHSTGTGRIKKRGLSTDPGGIPITTEPEVHPEILQLAEVGVLHTGVDNAAHDPINHFISGSSFNCYLGSFINTEKENHFSLAPSLQTSTKTLRASWMFGRVRSRGSFSKWQRTHIVFIISLQQKQLDLFHC